MLFPNPLHASGPRGGHQSCGAKNQEEFWDLHQAQASPGRAAHTAAPGDLLSNRTRLKPQPRALEHGEAAQQLLQKGRQSPKSSVGSRRAAGHRSPAKDTRSSSACPHGTCLPLLTAPLQHTQLQAATLSGLLC